MGGTIYLPMFVKREDDEIDLGRHGVKFDWLAGSYDFHSKPCGDVGEHLCVDIICRLSGSGNSRIVEPWDRIKRHN